MLTVLVLAGGASSRMGTDKAWLDLNGTPLVEHVIRGLLPIAGEVILSARAAGPFEPLLARLPTKARVVTDIHRGAGPLAGLHAGLTVSQFELTLAVATDMPFVSLKLVEHMVTSAPGWDAVAPLLADNAGGDPRPEPLHAVYRRTCLPAIEEALTAGRRRVVSFFPQVRVHYLSPETVRSLDPELLSFRNVNTPEDWAAAQVRLHKPQAGIT